MSSSSEQERRREAVRRAARLDEVFGQSEPAVSSDEQPMSAEGFDDRWWMEQRPPHHG